MNYWGDYFLNFILKNGSSSILDEELNFDLKKIPNVCKSDLVGWEGFFQFQEDPKGYIGKYLNEAEEEDDQHRNDLDETDEEEDYQFRNHRKSHTKRQKIILSESDSNTDLDLAQPKKNKKFKKVTSSDEEFCKSLM